MTGPSVDAETPERRDLDAWMLLALGEAQAALEHDDVPVGAVVIRSGEVIAARHNERELT
ncbi:MAG: tRNA-specific adenosine deaminase, partial [Actinomycetota bacterium]|nr:tRNA-specific adenosine deaminase [Actinomycetota bacterium]